MSIDDEVSKLVRNLENELGPIGSPFQIAQDQIEAVAKLLNQANSDGVRQAIEILESNFQVLKEHPEYEGLVEEAVGMDIQLSKGVSLLLKLRRAKLGRELTMREIIVAIRSALESA